MQDNPLQESQSDATDEHQWSQDVEQQLQNIECNASQQAAIAKAQYLELFEVQKWFKTPVIVISGLNSIFAVGLSSFMDQKIVSTLNCILAFIVATMGSIELYLGITKKMDVALTSHQNFYLLSIKINNCLRLDRAHRSELDGRQYLNESLNTYEQLFQSGNVTPQLFNDRLTNVEIKA